MLNTFRNGRIETVIAAGSGAQDYVSRRFRQRCKESKKTGLIGMRFEVIDRRGNLVRFLFEIKDARICNPDLCIRAAVLQIIEINLSALRHAIRITDKASGKMNGGVLRILAKASSGEMQFITILKRELHIEIGIPGLSS